MTSLRSEGEIQPVPTRLELRNIRVAVGIVDELVMGQMLQPIVMRAAEQAGTWSADRKPDHLTGDS